MATQKLGSIDTDMGEDLDFAFDSISAFSAKRDNQEALFGAEEGLKDISYSTHCFYLYMEWNSLAMCITLIDK